MANIEFQKIEDHAIVKVNDKQVGIIRRAEVSNTGNKILDGIKNALPYEFEYNRASVNGGKKVVMTYGARFQNVDQAIETLKTVHGHGVNMIKELKFYMA